MNTACIIATYFTCGKEKLPDIFYIWMKSCGWNPSVDFIVFTDCLIEAEPPANVKIIKLSFRDVKDRIQRYVPFAICLDRPYKLCDYKISYGEAFSDYLKGYDFWGFCDIDLVWGNIRDFITDEILEGKDRIFTRGHFSLFRNSQEVNMGYRTLSAEGCLRFEEVYSTPRSFAFDEWGGTIGGDTPLFC